MEEIIVINNGNKNIYIKIQQAFPEFHGYIFELLFSMPEESSVKVNQIINWMSNKSPNFLRELLCYPDDNFITKNNKCIAVWYFPTLKTKKIIDDILRKEI